MFSAGSSPRPGPNSRRSTAAPWPPICTQQEDLLYWQEQLAPYLKKLGGSGEPPKNALELVLMQTHILMELKDFNGVVAFLSKFYHRDKKLCMTYLNAMRHVSSAKARKAAQEIVKKTPPTTS